MKQLVGGVILLFVALVGVASMVYAQFGIGVEIPLNPLPRLFPRLLVDYKTSDRWMLEGAIYIFPDGGVGAGVGARYFADPVKTRVGLEIKPLVGAQLFFSPPVIEPLVFAGGEYQLADTPVSFHVQTDIGLVIYPVVFVNLAAVIGARVDF